MLNSILLGFLGVIVSVFCIVDLWHLHKIKIYLKHLTEQTDYVAFNTAEIRRNWAFKMINQAQPGSPRNHRRYRSKRRSGRTKLQKSIDTHSKHNKGERYG